MLIGLTGGIAAGKSTVSRQLSAWHIPVIDYDILARYALTASSPAVQQIVDYFGAQSVDNQGNIRRDWLASYVFSGEHPRALAKLNAIVHPQVYALAQQQQQELYEQGFDVIVHDIPLLAQVLEDLPWQFDHILTVEAPEEVRVQRMISTRGMSQQEAWDRIRSQASQSEREAIADAVLDATLPLEQMFAYLAIILSNWTGIDKRAFPIESEQQGKRGDMATIERINKPFVVKSPYKPSGDQPKAIDELAQRIEAGENDVVLMGATGTGKTATTAWLIERLQRPTLIIEPNKTLAAQLCAEFRELMPDNAVSYFVSYYDYYQPEAYIPQTDTYIEKDSNINDDVERLRHAATANLLTRRDCVVVATVSCIYGLGTPEEYAGRMVLLKVGQQLDRDALLRTFVQMQYTRNDIAFTRGTFRVRGDTVEIIPVYEELAVRIEFFGDEIDRISTLHPLTGDVIESVDQIHIFPASHYVAGPERMEHALQTIRQELDERVAELKKQHKELEAQRLSMRTTYDLEMLEQVGTCSGVENYSRHFDGRDPGTPPHTLLDFFPDDFLLVIDESHVTVPQIGAMYEGDASRKRTLVEHGFRLPSAMDNRPLKWPEFLERVGQTVYLSATPGDYEMGLSDGVVEQIIRPTGLVDPKIEVRPVDGQIDDLLGEIKDRIAKGERALVTTLTKKMAEDLTAYMLERDIKVEYLHSDVDTLRRVELLRQLREGKIDVIVGINLLREGLDLPEVSLVAILDADKEGFLRSYRSLIQTIGRAARNVSGTVLMYADEITDAMQKAIDETNRRRDIQIAYNTEHGIDPKPLIKKISDVNDMLAKEDVDTQELLEGGYRNAGKAGNSHLGVPSGKNQTAHDALLKAGLPAQDLADLIRQLSEQMHTAAEQLQFELAARLRDEIRDLKKELRQITNAKQ